VSDARILDRGYRRYDGERRGVPGAIRSVMVDSVRRMLGMKRAVWHKILPVLTTFIAYVPAIVFVGVIVLLPEQIIEDPTDATYAGYYFFITTAILLFTAVVGPDVVCTDRRTGMLGLYLASPLTRDTYLLAKGASIASVLSLVTIGPPLLLLIGYTLEGYGPDGPIDFVLLFVRILVAGAAISLLYTAIVLAVSSTTSRRAAASAGVAGIVIGTAVVSGILTEAADASPYFLLFNLFSLPFEVAVVIFGETSEDADLAELPAIALVGGYTAWLLALGLFARIRYQRMDVTR
jgi:ABC-2 type transport system permease protein